ncbi:hypothetical protein llap_125 [Limosa lapponica baueri]|uniref:Uncharacterized protein n=1 Tax=Limosa lapponica baueri TaxID=1758121 RepID=A0A2I0UU63_LIMLA|nr:hypothetical protein llap_125 [Limosa lapponica baueri]
MVLMDTKSTMSQQCAFLLEKTNVILGCIRRSVDGSLRKGILPFHSALVRQQLEYRVQFCAAQCKRDMEYTEKSPTMKSHKDD